MWLDELADLVRTLRARAENHAESLRQNETRTRYALIDPLLEAMGWDANDPALVTPEFTTGEGRPDYALLSDRPGGVPLAFVEAKKLGTPLQDRLGQVITYCNEKGVKYCVVTDGVEWGAYDVFKPVPNPDKLITRFSLKMPEHEAVIKMLWLWRKNFLSGVPVAPEITPNSSPTEPESVSVATHSQAVGPSNLAGWVPLSQLQVVGSFQKPPARIRFPDRAEASVSRWYELQIRAVEWLVRTRRLEASKCPITTERGTHLVHTSPTRRDGSSFVQPKQVEGLWIDLSYSAVDHVSQAQKILLRLGTDPATVSIELAATP